MFPFLAIFSQQFLLTWMLEIADIITTIYNMLVKRLLKIHLFERGSVQMWFFDLNVQFSEGSV